MQVSIEEFFVDLLKRWDAEMEKWERERRVMEDILYASPEEVVWRLQVYQDLANKSVNIIGTTVSGCPSGCPPPFPPRISNASADGEGRSTCR